MRCPLASQMLGRGTRFEVRVITDGWRISTDEVGAGVGIKNGKVTYSNCASGTNVSKDFEIYAKHPHYPVRVGRVLPSFSWPCELVGGILEGRNPETPSVKYFLLDILARHGNVSLESS